MAKAAAPSHLSNRSKGLYRAIVADFGLQSDLAALEVLRMALEHLDRADEARKLVDAEGIVLRDRFGFPKPHPAVTIERLSRAEAVRSFRELALPLPENAPASSGVPWMGVLA